MRLIARLFLLLFVVFLATPTAVSLIKKSTDTSCFFSFSEEEQPHKEFKAHLKSNLVETFWLFFPRTVRKAVFAQDYLHCESIASAIFIPPPEVI